MFVENFTKFIKYYGKGRKLKLFGFFLISLTSGLLELIGLALIYPFILLLLTPEKVVHTKYYLQMATFFHSTNVLANAFLIGALVMLVFALKNCFMVLTLFLQNRFVNTWKYAISKQYMNYYLFSSYKDTIKTSPAEKIYNLSALIMQALDGFVFRVITLVTNFIIVVMIITLLFVNFLIPAIITVAFTVFCLLFQHKVFKKRVGEISQKMYKSSSSNNAEIIKVINNIKEIKILSAESHFMNEYLQGAKECARLYADNNFYCSVPPYIIEMFVVISLFILAGLISVQNINNTSWIVASYALVAAAIFRIAPALNRIQSSINNINTSRGFVKTMVLQYEENKFDEIEKESELEIKFNEIIKLENINFAYKKDFVINDLSLDIKKGEFIGIIGASGVGKSTLADIIMGLLPIDGGKISVDDVELDNTNFSALRKLIGYVPQQINVLDGSFKQNVAFGIDEKDINDDKVIKVLCEAQLYDLVSSFDEGIDAKAIIGSGGLSQGQKQRLAIARALYRNSEILILDEATSSLDVETEYQITNMLNELKGEKTIIAIAHRLSTLKSCDRLVYLKDGKVIDTGSFDELSGRHADFEKLVKLSSLDHN